MVFLVQNNCKLLTPMIREGNGIPLQYSWASLVTQMVKNPPAMWDTWVGSLDWEDPLEDSMESLWTEELVGSSSQGCSINHN